MKSRNSNITNTVLEIESEKAVKFKKKPKWIRVKLTTGKKYSKVRSLLDKYKLNNSETVFMGDDLPDITVLQVCGLSSCPNDACPEVRSIVEYISIKNGGMGCVRDIIEQTLKAQGKWKLKETSKNI